MSVSALVISLSQRAKQHTDEIIVGYYSRHLLFAPEVLEMMRHLVSGWVEEGKITPIVRLASRSPADIPGVV